MHGNVWEWCRDSFHNYRDAGNVDPLGSTNGPTRISRGGNCFNGFGGADDWNVKSNSRSAVRMERRADGCLLDRGFRVMAALSNDVIQAKRPADASNVAPNVTQLDSGAGRNPRR